MMAAELARFLALGDSYTIGEGVADVDCWPQQLLVALRARGHALAAPEIIARTGWSTDQLAAAISAHDLRPGYALVSLLVGVNNQYRGRDTDNYRKQFTALLQHAIQLAGGSGSRIMVISIPDWGVSPFAHGHDRTAGQIAAEIDAFNAVARHEAEQVGAAFVDITAISRCCGNDTAMLAGDGLHPSAGQYALWLLPILAAAETCLDSN